MHAQGRDLRRFTKSDVHVAQLCMWCPLLHEVTGELLVSYTDFGDFSWAEKWSGRRRPAGPGATPMSR